MSIEEFLLIKDNIGKAYIPTFVDGFVFLNKKDGDKYE
jgi:hypothetical protein